VLEKEYVSDSDSSLEKLYIDENRMEYESLTQTVDEINRIFQLSTNPSLNDTSNNNKGLTSSSISNSKSTDKEDSTSNRYNPIPGNNES